MKISKGFTMLEIMVVVAIMGILFGITIPVVGVRAEKNALDEMELKIPIFIRGYIDRSFETGIEYKFEINFEEQLIKIYNNENKKIDELKLNNRLSFAGADYNTATIERETTGTGNFGKGFTIFIFDKKKNKLYTKITAYTVIKTIQFCKIRVYKPKDSDFISDKNFNNAKNSNELWEVDSDK